MIRKEEDPSGIHAGHHKAVLAVHRLPVPFINSRIQKLRVAQLVHNEDAGCLRDNIFLVDRFLTVLNKGTAGISVIRLDLGQILADQLIPLFLSGDNGLILPDLFHRLPVGLLQIHDLKADEPVELHLQDGVCLSLGEVELLRVLPEAFLLEDHAPGIPLCQAVLRVLPVSGAPDHRDHQIDDVAGGDKALLDLPLALFLFQKHPVLPVQDLMLEAQPFRKDPGKAHDLRSSVADGQHIDAEGVLQLCLFIQDIPDPVDVRILLELHEDADSVSGSGVSDIRDLRKLLCLHQLRRIGHELSDAGADHGVGNLRYDQLVLLAPLFPRLEGELSPKLQPSASRFVDALKL